MNFLANCPENEYCIECVQQENDKSLGTCKQCQFSIFNKKTNKCEEIEDTIDNCIIYKSNIDKIECQECDWGYGINTQTGECIQCNQIENCAKCNQKQCLACYNNSLIYQDSVTKDTSCDPKITDNCATKNCDVCDQDNNCLRCEKGFSLKEIEEKQICEMNVEACIIGEDLKCQRCDYGFYVTSDWNCHIFRKIIPHSFFSEMLYYLGSASIVVILFYLFFRITNAPPEENQIFVYPLKNKRKAQKKVLIKDEEQLTFQY